ncbi:MAG: hypothetical protein WCF26_22520 [Candidatus Sulfotelmatobacter sp.]
MPWWWPVIINVWALLGPLLGIFVGAYLARRWQRQQWIADNKKQEFKDLLGAMTRVNTLLVRYGGVPSPGTETIEAEQLVLVSETCLFISDFLEKSKVIGDLVQAMRMLENKRDMDAFLAEYHRITNRIREAAKKAA